MVDRANQLAGNQQAAVREQLQRILADQVFVRADRTSRFLQYIIDEMLAGRAQKINQYALATDVFDRDGTFDPAIDAIVRVEAGRLRSKLREYYEETGQHDPVFILLPKRTYVARLEFRPASANNNGVEGGGDRDESAPPIAVDETRIPTIAVLAFDNMSGDPEQDYFGDGLAEDLITDLSKLPGLSVIARQSSFSYKASPINIKLIGAELGADFVVEGSARVAGGKLRVNAQLISVESGSHIWADRFDRDISDIFNLQDEINANIVRALDLTLRREIPEAKIGRGTRNFEAYDYFLRGMNEARPSTQEKWEAARYCYRRAIELDPAYAAAYSYSALHMVRAWIDKWNKSREETVDQAVEWAQHAVSLDDQLAVAHDSLAWAYFWNGQHELAVEEAETANLLNPNDAEALVRFSFILCWTDHADRALRIVNKLERLSPTERYDFFAGLVHFMRSNYADAIRSFMVHIEHYPNHIPAHLYLASSLGLAGDAPRAMATVTKVKQLNPRYELDIEDRALFKNPKDRDRYYEGLRIGGLS
jgi:adenylate cyclase